MCVARPLGAGPQSGDAGIQAGCGRGWRPPGRGTRCAQNLGVQPPKLELSLPKPSGLESGQDWSLKGGGNRGAPHGQTFPLGPPFYPGVLGEKRAFFPMKRRHQLNF